MLSGEWDNTCTFGRPSLFQCEVCGKRFLDRWRLEVHQMTVAGSRWCR